MDSQTMPFAQAEYRLTEAERSLLARLTALHIELVETDERDADEDLALTQCVNDRLVAGAVDADRLKEWRVEDLEMTQAEFAETVGVSAGSVSDWESGDSRPGEGPLARMRQLARHND